MDKLKKTLSGQADDEEQGIMAQMSESATLSYSTRIKGFVITFILGILLSMLGTFFLFIPPIAKGMKLFALFYSIGNITAMCSTCFLMGPWKQLKRMFSETRIFATILVLVFMALTIMAAVWWKIAGLAIMFCALQFCAMLWYTLSYIPFARDAIKKCFQSCMGD